MADEAVQFAIGALLHLKSNYRDHLCKDSRCGAHCKTYNFGTKEPHDPAQSDKCPPSCGGHPDQCKECDQFASCVLLLRAMLEARTLLLFSTVLQLT